MRPRRLVVLLADVAARDWGELEGLPEPLRLGYAVAQSADDIDTTDSACSIVIDLEQLGRQETAELLRDFARKLEEPGTIVGGRSNDYVLASLSWPDGDAIGSSGQEANRV